MRLTSTGLGIGTSSPSYKLDVLSSGTANNAAGSPSARIVGTNQTVTSESAVLSVQSNSDMAVDTGGSVNFGGRGTTSSTASISYGHIAGRKENGTSGNFAGYLQFGTSDSGSDITERARIDSSGNLLVGTTTAGGTGLTVQKSGAGNPTGYFYNTSNSASGDQCGYFALGANANNTSSYMIICAQPGTRNVMYVYGNGNIVNVNNSYGTLSDVKLKENIVDATPKLDDVMRLKVRNFNLKSDPSHKQIGFVAQELEQVFPAMIDESPDLGEDGQELETKTKSVKTSVLVPILVKAIQELKAEFDAYKASHP
jgi:hypothetical protein